MQTVSIQLDGKVYSTLVETTGGKVSRLNLRKALIRSGINAGDLSKGLLLNGMVFL